MKCVSYHSVNHKGDYFSKIYSFKKGLFPLEAQVKWECVKIAYVLRLPLVITH